MAVLALGRQQASLGHAIGRTITDRLDYRIVDNATISADAGRYGATIEARGPDLEEHQPTFLERLREDRSRYRTMLRCAVANVANEGNVVIVGLASPAILADISHVVKVAVFASEATRVDRLIRGMPKGGAPIARDAAARILRQSDRQRAGYLRYLFNVDWLDPLTYDVMLNTNQISVEMAVSHILRAMLERPEKQPTVESQARLAELAISSRIEATLISQDEVWVNRPRAVFQGDEIHLSGEVATAEDAERATEIAINLGGGRHVVSQLRLLPMRMLDTV